MFNKLKHIKGLRDQAKTMQNALSDEKVSTEKSGVSITMDGNMAVIDLKLNPELNQESLSGILKDCINENLKKTQRLMATKMKEMGGFPGMS